MKKTASYLSMENLDINEDGNESEESGREEEEKK